MYIHAQTHFPLINSALVAKAQINIIRLNIDSFRIGKAFSENNPLRLTTTQS